MTGLHLTHRRAQRFAGRVDGEAPSDGGHVDLDTELLALVTALRAVPVAQPRASFSTDLRDRLMVLAETELTPVSSGSARSRGATPTREHRPRERRIAVGLAAVAIVGASSSMAVASQNALPGDTLYPLKRAIEDAHTHLSVGDRAEGTTLLHSAGDRLDEARDLTTDGGGDGDSGPVTDSLNSFTRQLSQGADLLMRDYRQRGAESSINMLRRFDAESTLTLSALDNAVPQESKPALLAAAEKLFTIDAAAGQLCPECSETGITEIPPTLLASDTRDAVDPEVATPDGATGPTASGGRHAKPLHTVSPQPTARPTPRPTSRPSPTSSPSGQPTSVPTTAPTVDPTHRASPTNDIPTLLPTPSSRPTHNVLPSGKPSLPLPLPTSLPTIDGLASGLASAVATAVSQLLSGLTGR